MRQVTDSVSMTHDTLATKRDLTKFELHLKSEIHAAEQRMTITFGWMFVVAVGMIVTLQKLL